MREEQLVSRSRTAVNGSAADHSSAGNRRPRQLDVGFDSHPGRADLQPPPARREDLNNNDDDDDDGTPPGEFQTDSSRRWTDDEEPCRRPAVVGHDVRFIDDDCDSELDQRELDGRSTTSVGSVAACRLCLR